MSQESCSKVLSTAGEPRHVPLRQSRPYQSRACFLFRLSHRVDPFLRWQALKSFSPTHRSQLGKILSVNLYSSNIYNSSLSKLEFLFACGVVVDVHYCWYIFFQLGLLIIFLHMSTCYLLRGIVCFYLVTHTPTLQGFCTDTHRFTLKCWWSANGVGVGATNQPTHHPMHPANHLFTNSHSSTHTHPARMQGFCANVHRFTMEAIPRLLLEHSKIKEPPTQQPNAVKNWTNKASVTLLIPMTTSFSDRVVWGELYARINKMVVGMRSVTDA